MALLIASRLQGGRMSQTTARKPKLELAVNRKETITLLSDEPHFDIGQYGTWALISVEHNNAEKTWFPPYHVALYLKNNCGLGDLLSVCKMQEAGERSTTWLINDIEVPFVRDPAREENGASNGAATDAASREPQPIETQPRARSAAQPAMREHGKSAITLASRDHERIRLEALRAAIEYAKAFPVSGQLNPEEVVEAARAFQGFLKEG